MKTYEILKRERELMVLCEAAKESSKQFSEACQFAALKADTTPAVVRRYIVAMASEKANTLEKEAEQLTMLFQALPTVTEQAA